MQRHEWILLSDECIVAQQSCKQVSITRRSYGLIEAIGPSAETGPELGRELESRFPLHLVLLRSSVDFH